jgi:hypothetical protein
MNALYPIVSVCLNMMRVLYPNMAISQDVVYPVLRCFDPFECLHLKQIKTYSILPIVNFNAE